MSRRAALAMVLANALVSAALVGAYALWREGVKPPIAALDVAELFRLKERQVTASLLKHGATEDERAAALMRAGAFGADIAEAIKGLPAECRCLILARGAIVGSEQALPDLTPVVRQRLGL